MDLAIVVLFVALGRMTHDHGITLAGLASTSWPFAVGVAVAWSALALRHASGSSFAAGLWLAVTTVTVGMVLRRASGQGTAVAFVIVALAFLSLGMLGWRTIRTQYLQRRHG